MKQRLSLENDANFLKAIEDIIHSKFEKKAKERESNILKEKLRRLIVQSFLYHVIKRYSNNSTQENLHLRFESSHDERQFNIFANINL